MLVSGWVLRTSDFDAQMSGIKFWKNIEWLLHFGRVEWGIKNPSFYTDFKNVHWTLVKSALKKNLANFLGLGQFFNWQTIFLAKTYLGCTFYQDLGLRFS
jgi:hypothetical protein